MKKRFSQLVIMLSFIFVLPAFAQQLQVLNLDKAIKLSLDQSKSLKIAQSNVDIASAKYESVHESYIPSITISGSYNAISAFDQPAFFFGGKSVELLQTQMYSSLGTASIKEMIFSGFRYKYSNQSFKYLEQASKLDFENSRQEIVFNTASAYYNIYKIKATKRLLEENFRQTEEHLNEVKNYEKQGISTHNDVLKVQLQQSNLQLALIDIENTQKVAIYNLNIMLGIDTKTNTDIDTTLALQNSNIHDYEALQKLALERNDIKAAGIRVKASENSMKSTKSTYYPNFALSGSYYYINPNSQLLPSSGQYFSLGLIGATVSYDISALYTNKNHVKEATAKYTQSQVAYEQLTDAAKMEVNQTYLSFLQAKDKIKVANESVQQALENYNIVKSKYSNQVALLTDLLDADLLLLQAKINLSNSSADLELAYYKVQKVTGDLKY